MTGLLFAFVSGVLLAAPGPAGPSESAPQSIRAQGGQSWQQGVHYTIEARLDEETDILQGRMRIRYTNESPDTLREFYLHQYLNAFRPNSLWATRDLEVGNRTFQDLGPDEHAFERLVRASVDGQQLLWTHPNSPDSTIVRLDLPRPLPPGRSITVDLDWLARLSTVPRRQGREGRHFDFAQWYPRVVVYDREGWRPHPLYRQGEFYGEFATYDVTLEVARDQVVGATGVPIDGDPGWERALAQGASRAPLQSDWYGSEAAPPCVDEGRRMVCGVPGRGPALGPALGLVSGGPRPGNRRVRWYAENVHHFAWAVDPEFIYEGGVWNGVSIHVLYRPGDEESWGGGIAVQRTATALAWLDQVFGPYAYPQVTNLHRLDGGGTEFPMVVMDASASQSLILHEVGHIYAHGILGNNEWYEGWLDEGMSSFITSWFFEEMGAGRQQWLGSERAVLDLELQGKSEPVVFAAEDYSEYAIYSRMVYTKGSLILRMLRDMAGDETMVEILRTYYDRYMFRHVDSQALQDVAEEVMRQDLDWFFGPWLHSSGLVDYHLDDVQVEEVGGVWATTLQVRREGDLVMPVPVRLSGEGQVMDTVLHGGPLKQKARVITRFRPRMVALDPDGAVLDWNTLNNYWTSNWFVDPAVDRRLPRPTPRPSSSRDQKIVDYLPLVWWNSPGGYALGFESKANYMGRYNRSLFRLGLPGIIIGDKGGSSDEFDWGSVYYRVTDPILGGHPRLGHEVELFAGEGRVFGRYEHRSDRSRLPVSGPRRTLRFFTTVSAVYDSTYLVPGRWTERENITVEGGLGYAYEGDGGGSLHGSAEGSLGISTRNRRYFQVRAEAGQRWDRPRGWQGGWRVFAGTTVGEDPNSERTNWDGSFAPVERRMFLSGGAPYGAVSNPYLRSDGALLDEAGDVPGDGELRGFHRGFTVPSLVAANVEFQTPSLTLGPLRARVGVFADGAWTSENLIGVDRNGEGYAQDPQDRPLLWDVGPSIDLESDFTESVLRIDFPIYVSNPSLARGNTEDHLAFRFRISVRPMN